MNMGTLQTQVHKARNGWRAEITIHLSERQILTVTTCKNELKRDAS
jgi:hypothetical protein